MSGHESNSDEIDLFELLLQLWNGRKTIIITVCFTVMLAVGYLNFAKEKWTSIAIITPPQLGQLADYSNMKKALEIKIQTITTELDAQVKTAQEKKVRRLSVLSEALKIAEATNTKSIMLKEANELSDEMLFMLGVPALKTIIANESFWPLYLSDSYYSNLETLRALGEIKIRDDRSVTLEAFSFSQQPSLPVIKDAPKKTLILVLSVLLGGLIGAGIVLCREFLRHYSAS
ncbi:Wzz/FepE/Etk N-terminal domain-containing protein [Hafnia alvei]|uniref:Chain length determinant protein n=2 Tax=Hafnia alvei TaxID=569 RepID=A0A377TIH9_HAFAL|nr:Wzz/FepE/Etk N-terminal domain-containing protein [Hafnia alvei]KFC82510.1 O-antigen lipopolysaccharide chain length regulator [Hafnia alvei ATCC 13337]RLR06017.1 hypothetical protein EAE69_22275 [Hafnia alvei ATCC 13337]TBM33603.1 hypothetical protein EYY91_01225 [Hafnia alvei]WQD27664.1 Wzz/FepE/Etk N-terminal domain-containing protein [Hafnia alvei]STS20993.1 Polysaccharide antigen chain regulator [Hafnia alvei]